MASVITFPTPGSTLRGSIQVFTWDHGDQQVENSYLYIGSSPGNTRYGARNVTSRTLISFGQLPVDGSTVHVRLWSRVGGVWQFVDEQFTAASSSNLPNFTEPRPGGRLVGETQTLRWNFGGLQITESWLYLGSIRGGSDYAVTSTGSDTSAVVTGLPTDRGTVHATLYFSVAGAWYSTAATFEAASVEPPTRGELTRELQGLVGATPDGAIGPRTRAALNRNWLGRQESFDPSFATRFTNDADLVRWVQRRINTRSNTRLELDGDFDQTTETAVVRHLDRGGVVAAESFLELLDPS